MPSVPRVTCHLKSHSPHMEGSGPPPSVQRSLLWDSLSATLNHIVLGADVYQLFQGLISWQRRHEKSVASSVTAATPEAVARGSWTERFICCPSSEVLGLWRWNSLLPLKPFFLCPFQHERGGTCRQTGPQSHQNGYIS